MPPSRARSGVAPGCAASSVQERRAGRAWAARRSRLLSAMSGSGAAASSASSRGRSRRQQLAPRAASAPARAGSRARRAGSEKPRRSSSRERRPAAAPPVSSRRRADCRAGGTLRQHGGPARRSPARAPRTGNRARSPLRPVSPVRMRIASPIGRTKTLPSPIEPVLAAAMIVGHHLVHQRVGHHDLDLHLGQEVDRVLRAAVELGVALLAPEAPHLGDRHADHADLGSASFTSSSLNGLMIASIFFMRLRATGPCLERPCRYR